MQLRRQTLLAATALLALTGVAQASPMLGLTGEKTLVMFDSADPSKVKTMEVKGVNGLLGIDLRPATGEVIGVDRDGGIHVIDLATGEAKMKSKMDKMLPLGEAPVVVDFNPAADKLRFMTGTTNHRVDVDSGKVTVDGSLAFLPQDMHKGETPNIVAAAYINSHGKPEKTAMYDVDATIGGLIRQVAPNDGTLSAIGKFGIDKAKAYAFDVQTTADGKNTAWLIADNVVHTVDLETGKATMKGKVGGDWMLRDVTALMAK